MRSKKGEAKIEHFNFTDLSSLINKKIEGKNLLEFIFDVYRSNASSSNLKELQIFNSNSMRILEKITKSDLLGFDFSGFENMKKFYDTNLQNLLIYVNKNKMLLNHINKNYLRQIEFKLTNQLASDIECYKRSLEDLGKYFMFKVKKENGFYLEVKKAIAILFEIAQKVKSKVCGLMEKLLKEKKLEEILSRNNCSKNNAINNGNNLSLNTNREITNNNNNNISKARNYSSKTKITNEKGETINSSFYSVSATSGKSVRRKSNEKCELDDYNSQVKCAKEYSEKNNANKTDSSTSVLKEINNLRNYQQSSNSILAENKFKNQSNSKLNTINTQEKNEAPSKTVKQDNSSEANSICEINKENLNMLNLNSTAVLNQNAFGRNKNNVKSCALNQSMKMKYKI